MGGGTLVVLEIPGTSHEEPVGVYPAHDARHHGKQDVKARRPADGVPRIQRLRTPEDWGPLRKRKRKGERISIGLIQNV